MTYNPSVPNAAQSPGLFPPQNSTNFTRLKTIISGDHVFNDTAQATDGVHNQVTMIARDTPVSLPAGTNAILYTMIDSSGAAQLNYWNGADNFQITPIFSAPLKVVGSVALSGEATSSNVYTIPPNSFGTIFLNYIVPAGGFYRYYMFYRTQNLAAQKGLILQSDNTGRPDISFGGSSNANIRIVNGDSNARTVAYYIIVESLP